MPYTVFEKSVYGDHRIYKYVRFSLSQGSHRLEKYLNIQDCLEKSLKIKFALKSTGKILNSFEKSLNFTIYKRFNTVFGDLNQYKIVLLLFGAAYAAPNKGTTIYTNFLKLISLVMQPCISEVEF